MMSENKQLTEEQQFEVAHEEEQSTQMKDMLDEIVIDTGESDEPESEESVKFEGEEEDSQSDSEVVEEEQKASSDTDDEVSFDAKETADEETKESSQEVEEETTEFDQVAALQAQLDTVSAQALNINPPQKTEEQIVSEQEPITEKGNQVVRDLVPFVSDEVYEKALTDPQELNVLLNQVYDQAVSYMTQNIPQLVGTMINQQTSMQGMVDNFYKENEDLLPMKSYVGFVANEIAAKHPEWEYEQLFGEVATEVRKRVNISKKASRVEDDAKEQRPAFAKKPTGRQNVGKRLSELESDMADLM